MSYIQKFQDSEFPTIYCTELIIKPRTTPLKWNPARKDPGISIKGTLDTIKSNYEGKNRGVLGAQVFNIGTDTRKWYFDIYETVAMYVGLAPTDQSTSSIDGVYVSQYIKAVQTDRIIFKLTTNNITIQHMLISGVVRHTMDYDLTEFAGQQACIWACTTKEDTMSLKLMELQEFKTTVDTSGSVRMTGRNNDIVDFNIVDINNNSGIASDTFNGAVLALNALDEGPGVTTGISGIEVKRGDETSRQLIYVESTDRWETGVYGGTLGTDTFTITENAEVTQTDGAIPGYNSDGRLSEASGLIPAEVAQIHTIYNANVEDTAWPYINNLNQPVGTDSTVTFTNVKKSVSNTLTSDTTLSNYISVFDTTLNSITASLPDCATNKGIEFVLILKTYGDGNPLVITPSGADTIEGMASINITGDSMHITVIAVEEWMVV